MKLCQIVPSLEARHGGPAKSVRRLAGALAGLGHEVDLLTTAPEAGTAEKISGSLRVRTFPRGRPELVCPSAELRACLSRQRYDCVHHHSLWLRTLHYARRNAAAGRCPLVISPRGMLSPWAWNHRRWKKWLAGKFIHPGALRQAQGWHATSEAEARDIRQLGFPQPICVAPNGVDEPSAGDVALATTVWSRLCPAVTSRPVALFYSRFHRKKRLLELIDLWIDRAPRDWLLLVAGISQEYSVAQLKARVARRGADERVAVFSGQDRPPPYAVASLFLLPSHSENYGMVIAEALANGVPVAVTNATPWHEANAAGAGWCVPWENYPAALAAALAEGPERLRARGAAARAWVLENYSWEKSAGLLAGFYRDLRRVNP